MKSKRHLLAVSISLISLTGIVMVSHTQVQAGGSGSQLAYVTLSSSTISSPVGSNVTLTLRAHFNNCTSDTDPSQSYPSGVGSPGSPPCAPGYHVSGEVPDANDACYGISVTGSGNNLSASNLTTDNTGNAQVTLNSSVAETKTVNVNCNNGTYIIASQTITFSAAPAQITPTPTSKPSVAKTPAVTTPTPTSAPTTEATAPTAPIFNIILAGSTIASTDTPTVQSNKPIVLSGTTLPNGVVNISVHSALHTYTVTADKSGNWTYTVPTADLPPGTHHIDATVTDPATGKTSPSSQVLAFSLAKVLIPASTIAPKSKAGNSSTLTTIAAIVGSLVVLFALLTAYIWKFQSDIFKTILERLHLSTRPPVSQI